VDQKDFVFVFSDLNAVGRGNVIDLNVLVRDADGNPVEGAEIYFEDSSGNKVNLNSIGSGYYFASYEIPADSTVGEHRLSFLAAKGLLVGVQDLVLNVAKGNVNAVLLRPLEHRAFAGQELEIAFFLVYDNGDRVLDGNASAMMNGKELGLAMDENGIFYGSYLFSQQDLEGAVFAVFSSDSLGNEGTTTITFVVQNPLPLTEIGIGLLLAIAVLVAVYGLKRAHRLSALLHRAGKLEKEAKATKLKHSIEKEKSARETLAKKIEVQEKELDAVKKDIDFERRRQSLAISKVPMESGHAVHKAAFGLTAKVKGLFSGEPKMTEAQLGAEKRIAEIDTEVGEIERQVKALEDDYFRQSIKEDSFKKKLFELHEKMHLLELEKKKIE
jgi:hypothetical protein